MRIGCGEMTIAIALKVGDGVVLGADSASSGWGKLGMGLVKRTVNDAQCDEHTRRIPEGDGSRRQCPAHEDPPDQNSIVEGFQDQDSRCGTAKGRHATDFTKEALTVNHGRRQSKYSVDAARRFQVGLMRLQRESAA